jgi:hypothetical protein
VNAVAIGRQVYPNRADRIVRARLDGEGLSGIDTLERIFWIIAKDRIVIDLCYLQVPEGDGFSSLPTGAG